MSSSTPVSVRVWRNATPLEAFSPRTYICTVLSLRVSVQHFESCARPVLTKTSHSRIVRKRYFQPIRTLDTLLVEAAGQWGNITIGKFREFGPGCLDQSLRQTRQSRSARAAAVGSWQLPEPRLLLHRTTTATGRVHAEASVPCLTHRLPRSTQRRPVWRCITPNNVPRAASPLLRSRWRRCRSRKPPQHLRTALVEFT